MFWIVVLNFIAQVSCAYDYYSDIDWSSSNQQQQYQNFNPSSKYDTAYPNQNLYENGILASNFVNPEDLLGQESLIDGINDTGLLYTNQILLQRK